MLNDAVERGGLFAEILLRSRADWLARLAEDDVSEAEAGLLRVGEMTWARFGSARFHQMMGRVEILLYQGDGIRGWRLLTELWPEIERTKMLEVQVDRIQALQLRCRSGLAAARALAAEDRVGILRAVRRDLRRLERQNLGWSDALASLIRAGLATLDGDLEKSMDRLVTAEVGFETSGMELYAVLCRRCRGRLMSIESSEEDLFREADRWMSDQGIRAPERLAEALAPGIWEVRGEGRVSENRAALDSSSRTA